MQLVLSNNRIVAHGENFLSMGGVVINTETGAKYENATIAECDGCPADIDKVGYEYRAGVFVPCAPYGVGNNNGYFMEVCESCATPRSSGIPIKNGLKLENLDLNSVQIAVYPIVWENSNPSRFSEASISVERTSYVSFIVEFADGSGLTLSSASVGENVIARTTSKGGAYERTVTMSSGGIAFSSCKNQGSGETGIDNTLLVPVKIYGMKLWGEISNG